MEKKEARAQFHRSNILEAAKVLFLEKGIQATTMDHIAASAQYSKSTLYVYFHSKEEIYYSLINEGMELLHQRIREVGVGKTDFKACYDAVCDTLIIFARQYPLYFEGVQQEIPVVEEALEKMPVLKEIYQKGEALNETIKELLELGVRQGAVDPEYALIPTAFALWAGICGLISMAEKKQMYLAMGAGMSKDQFLKQGFSLLLRGLRREK